MSRPLLGALPPPKKKNDDISEIFARPEGSWYPRNHIFVFFSFRNSCFETRDFKIGALPPPTHFKIGDHLNSKYKKEPLTQDLTLDQSM